MESKAKWYRVPNTSYYASLHKTEDSLSECDIFAYSDVYPYKVKNHIYYYLMISVIDPGPDVVDNIQYEYFNKTARIGIRTLPEKVSLTVVKFSDDEPISITIPTETIDEYFSDDIAAIELSDQSCGITRIQSIVNGEKTIRFGIRDGKNTYDTPHRANCMHYLIDKITFANNPEYEEYQKSIDISKISFEQITSLFEKILNESN